MNDPRTAAEQERAAIESQFASAEIDFAMYNSELDELHARLCECGHLGATFEGEHRTHDGHCGAYVNSREDERCECISFHMRRTYADMLDSEPYE